MKSERSLTTLRIFLSQIDRAFAVATQFFTHSVEDKEKCTRVGNDNNGYVCLEREK